MSTSGESEMGRWEVERIGPLVEVRFVAPSGRWFIIFDRPEFLNFLRGCMQSIDLAGLAQQGYSVVPTWALNRGRNEPRKDEQGSEEGGEQA